MVRMVSRLVLAFGFVAGLVWISGVTGQSQSPSQLSSQNGEWPHYGADLKNSRYSPLDQVNASNFNKLEVAWRFKTDNLGARPEYKLEGTPLMIKGIIYATGGTRRSVVALDAGTGELLWTHNVREGTRAGLSPRQLSGRGLAYWTDGRGDERILYITVGYQLVELNAKTGQPISSFGRNGIVDLKAGAVKGRNEQIDLETGEIGIHSTPVVAREVVIVGSSFGEGGTVPTHNNTKGLVRAFDVKTGKMLWRFNTIPGPGEFGNETWQEESWAFTGNTGVWTQISVDEELGLVYLPVETPTSDSYGGQRPGNNLFAESLVCVDLRTGQRKWHFQLVHHPIWNFDNSSAPLLMDINVDGRAIKAVALPSKQAFLYVFDRVTGQPVWPIEERPVPQSDVPGEKTSPTQPHPTKPPAYARNYLKVPDDLIDFTPEIRQMALERLKRYKWAPTPFNPPVAGDLNGIVGAVGSGTASNWPGAGFDPETHIVYVQAANTPGGGPGGTLSVRPPPPGITDIRYVAGIAGAPFGGISRTYGYGQNPDAPPREGTRSSSRVTPAPAASSETTTPAAGGGGDVGLNVQGLPIVKPPYGVLTAVRLDRGEIQWQVPFGDTPDSVRNHPLLKGMNIAKTGFPEATHSGGVGIIITKTLVIAGDGVVTSTPGRPRGAMLRAFNKATGEEVGAVWMPAQQSGTPMTYLHNGRQYIIVGIGGGTYTSEYIAFRLPS